MKRLRTPLPVVCLCSILMIVGCKKVENPVLKSVAPEKLEAGWSYHDVAESGFSIAAPADWTENPNESMFPGGVVEVEGGGQVPMDKLPPGVQELGKEIEKHDKETEAAFREKLKENGVSIMLFFKGARSIPGEERTRFYVKVRPSEGTLAEEAAATKAGLHGSETIEQKHVELPVGPAEAFKASRKTQGGDEVTEIIYLMVSGDKTYVTRFVTSNSAERITSISNPIMQTFRVK